jgi:O-antigen ligase
MNVEATVQRQKFLSQPRGIILVILAIVVVWGFSPISPLTLVLLAVAVLFLLGLKRPLWAMAALLVSELTVTSYMINTPITIISLRLLMLILLGFIIWRSRAQNQIKLGPGAKRVIIPTLVLLGLSILSNMIYSGFDFAFKDFRGMLVGILIIIYLPAVVRNLHDLKILCGVVFIGMTASALIGLMQHYYFLGMDEATLIPGFSTDTAGDHRVSGIAESALYLSFTLPIVFFATLGVYLAKGLESNARKLLILGTILMLAAVYFTYTRSALFALAPGLLALVLFLKTRIKGDIVLFFALAAILFIEITGLLGGTYLGGREQEGQAESSYERKVLWQAGIAIAMDNPVLGIGGDQYPTVAPKYASSVDPELMKRQESYWEYRTLGSQEPHNDFLGIWLKYGTIALAAYIWIMVIVMRNFLNSYRISTNRFIRGLAVGLAAALIAYVANAFYHNCMAAMPLFWIIAGFSVATVKLALKTKGYSKISLADAKN